MRALLLYSSCSFSCCSSGACSPSVSMCARFRVRSLPCAFFDVVFLGPNWSWTYWKHPSECTKPSFVAREQDMGLPLTAGLSYYLGRMPGHLGTHLALTGVYPVCDGCAHIWRLYLCNKHDI